MLNARCRGLAILRCWVESKHSRRKTRHNFGVCHVLPGAITVINGLSASMAIHGPASPVGFSDKRSEAEPNLCSEVNSLTSHPSPFLGTLEVVTSSYFYFSQATSY